MNADFRRFLAESFRRSLRLVATATETLLLVLPPILPLLRPLVGLLLVLLVLLMLPPDPLVGLQLVHLPSLLGQLVEPEVSHQIKAGLLVRLLLYDLLRPILYQDHPFTATPMGFTAVLCQKKSRGKKMTPPALLPPYRPTLHLLTLQAWGAPLTAYRIIDLAPLVRL